MQTLNGTKIPQGTKGLLYLCDYDYETADLTIMSTIAFDNESDAINAYSNIPNPASQLAVATKNMTFEEALTYLHLKMNDLQWRKGLADVL